MSRLELPGHDALGIRAGNPGPLTLEGTNSWILGRRPAWVVDPGPALDEHLENLAAEIDARGGLGGIALTHDHPDHAQGTAALLRRYPDAVVAGAGGDVEVVLADGSSFGPLTAVATPGHAPDHLSYLAGEVAFTGDAVLGNGSVFIFPYPGALSQYLEGLRRLQQHDPALLCPGHGPPVEDAAVKLEQYIAHRLERERLLLAALERGKRSVEDLLDDAWSDVPAALRQPAAWTLAAHLDKLEEEGRLPPDVERPQRELRPGSSGENSPNRPGQR